MSAWGEEVVVEVGAAGVPVAVYRQGRRWQVCAEPMRWFERTKWWRESRRMPKGQGRIDVPVWRVQLRLGHNSRSDLMTLDLMGNPNSSLWRVRDAQQQHDEAA